MNLFTNTHFRLAEEDRLTAALLCVLEHADRRLLIDFSALCGVECSVQAAAAAEFDVQVVLPSSRPDCVIRLGDAEIVIEAKHTAPFDANQFRRHSNGLAERAADFRRPTLVALTGNRREVRAIRESVAAVVATGGRATQVTWPEVVKLVIAHVGRSGVSETTQFLIGQFADYLRDLGYAAPKRREVTTVQFLNDAAAAILTVRRTATAVDSTLEALRDELKRTDGGAGLKWQMDAFRSVDFRFLDAAVQPSLPLRLRVVPFADERGNFQVKFYATFNPKAATACAKALDAKRGELMASNGADLVCGVEADGIFRVLGHLPTELVGQLYAGNEDALCTAAEIIGRLFHGVRRAIADVR